MYYRYDTGKRKTGTVNKFLCVNENEVTLNLGHHKKDFFLHNESIKIYFPTNKYIKTKITLIKVLRSSCHYSMTSYIIFYFYSFEDKQFTF